MSVVQSDRFQWNREWVPHGTNFNKLQHLSSKMVGSSGTETGFLMAAFQAIATPLQQNGWFQWNREWGKGGEAQQASQVEMKLDYLRLCSRASDNPGFIWFSDFTCIRSSRWVLGGSLEAGVFKLRALLGERTPKNHSAVKKDIPES